MKYLIVKRNLNSNSWLDLCKESLEKKYNNSIRNHIKNSNEWT